MSAYQVRWVHIGTSEQSDELARECGWLYNQTVTPLWRTVRCKDVYLNTMFLANAPRTTG